MTKKISLYLIHSIIIISTIIIVILGVGKGASDGQVGESIVGVGYFKPFTIDSNVLMGITSLLFIIIFLCKKKIPTWMMLLHYASTISVLLTFLTVVFFLTPTMYMSGGFKSALALYIKDMTFFHVLNPILSLVSFLLLEEKIKLTIKENLIGVIPMFIYSIVYVLNVVILKNWSDFYGFTFGGNYQIVPLVLIIMYLVTYLIGFAVRKIKEKHNK